MTGQLADHILSALCPLSAHWLHETQQLGIGWLEELLDQEHSGGVCMLGVDGILCAQESRQPVLW